MRILFVHGWGCDRRIWQPLETSLRSLLTPVEINCTSADFGFYGAEQRVSGHFDLAVGHSLGGLWLLTSGHVTFDSLVLINSFNCFVATAGYSDGWSQRIVQRMRTGLTQDVNQVLEQFWEKAGLTELPTWQRPDQDQMDIERLDWGLEALINEDGREQWDNFQGPRRVIAATKDNIVTQQQTQACFPNGDIQWLKSDCHALPLKFPEICAALVRELIEVS